MLRFLALIYTSKWALHSEKWLLLCMQMRSWPLFLLCAFSWPVVAAERKSGLFFMTRFRYFEIPHDAQDIGEVPEASCARLTKKQDLKKSLSIDVEESCKTAPNSEENVNRRSSVRNIKSTQKVNKCGPSSLCVRFRTQQRPSIPHYAAHTLPRLSSCLTFHSFEPNQSKPNHTITTITLNQDVQPNYHHEQERRRRRLQVPPSCPPTKPHHCRPRDDTRIR